MTRIGSKQAATLLQLSAGYVIASTKDPYKALRAKGLVEDSPTYMRGDVEYERKSRRSLPTLTRDGHTALREFVNQNGRLEIEMRTPLVDWMTVIRMDPVATAFDGKERPQ